MEVTLVGIDAGRGLTKVVVNEKRKVCFPSVVGHAPERRFSQVMATLDRNGEVLCTVLGMDNKERRVHMLVGQEAMEQSLTARQELSQERRDEDMIALLAEAFLLCDVEGRAKVVLGAPVDYYSQVKANWTVFCSERGSMVLAEGDEDVQAVNEVNQAGQNSLVTVAGDILDYRQEEERTVYRLSDGIAEIEVICPFSNHLIQPRGKTVVVHGVAQYRGKYRDVLGGSWTINGSQHVQVEDLKVLPEPAGTWANAALDLHGGVKDKAVLEGTTGVVDIGMYTTDFCIFGPGGKFFDPYSFSVPMGMSYVLQETRRYLLEGYTVDVPFFSLSKEVKEKRAMVRGLGVDLTDVVDAAVKDLVDLIVSHLRSRWERLMTLDKILVSGGGAYYVSEAIEDVYAIASRVRDSEWANAYGFRAFAHWQWGGK